MAETENVWVNSQTVSILIFDQVCFDVICKEFEKTIFSGIYSG
jgi:hypothetical protein